MNFRYKPGDMVTIRSDLKEDVRYYMRSGPGEDTGYAYFDPSCMGRLRGQTVHIGEYAYGDRYFVREDKQCFSWTDDMFVNKTDKEASGIKFNSLL